MARRKTAEARMAALVEEHRRLGERLRELGFIWPGTIQWRLLTCGKPNCACHTDPDARHGPYAYWTSKEAQKTVSKLLSAEEAAVYEEWINNRRELDRIIRKMYRLSRSAAKFALSLRAEGKKRRGRGS